MRQAVVIIHGVGEQRPMVTIRKFVAGALGLKELRPKDRVYSKPDRISDTLELRRLHAQPGRYGEDFQLDENCETDFYELYWQHLMQGTGWLAVWRWAIPLLWRRLPPRLRIIRRKALLLAGCVVALLLVIGLRLFPMLKSTSQVWLALFGLMLLVLVPIVIDRTDLFLLGFLGDAARYLSPDPPNVGVRRAIRTAGLTLLRGLHDDELRRYERIIVVGHSLGSVIAYDVITWLWQELHHLVEPEPCERKTVPTEPAEPGSIPNGMKPPLCQLGAPEADGGLEQFCARQRELWASQRHDGLPWRITDLVTLGSPLTHADLLLADGQKDLNLRKAQREFPTCPPSPEDPRDSKLLWRSYASAGKLAVVRILHHGAPFAVTRWTNLYFPGDFIGGRVSDHFGTGVKDVELSPDASEQSDAHCWWSHTRYWHPQEKKACHELRAALDLNASSIRAEPTSCTTKLDQA